MRELIRRIVFYIIAIVALVTLMLVVIAWSKRHEIMVATKEWIGARMLPGNGPPPRPEGPDAVSYEVLSRQLADWRFELAARHRKAATPEAKAAIEDEARIILEHQLPAMMRCWLGTKWDFNGTAAKPGEGKIACGYFVSTVLRDAGLDVNRFRLAQQPASLIIETFIHRDDTTTASRQDYQVFVERMAERPTGVYICGLDTHVGFIVNKSDGFRFIHSSGSDPYEVVDESPEDAGVLQRSKIRMIGNLTANRDFIRLWLAGKPITVKRS